MKDVYAEAVRELTVAEEEAHPQDIRIKRLERLGELKEKGVLTATEFQAEKEKALSA